MEVRILNVVTGIWLVVSAFVAGRSPAQAINAVAVGAASTAIALAAVRVPAARWLNMLLAMWLFASVLVLPRRGDFGFWNDLLVATAIFFTSGVESFDEEMRRPREDRRATG